MRFPALIWIVFAGCMTVSFLLSGMEAGVFALSRLRIRQQMRAGKASARLLHQYLEHPENFLWTILVGNTVANLFSLGWIVVELHRVFRHQHVLFVAIFTVVVFFFYAFSDLLPKMLFRMFPNRLCLFLARPFRWVRVVLRPLVAVVEFFSRALLRWRGGKVFTGHLFGNREELRLVLQETAQSFSSEERAMINRVLDLQTLTVRQAMKPMSEAATVKPETSLAEVLSICRDRKLTRMPVVTEREGRQRVIGLMELNSVIFEPNLDETRRVADVVRPALFLEEDLRLEVALRRMQRGGQRLAIVLSRERREIGIITLQDVLRFIFGEVSL